MTTTLQSAQHRFQSLLYDLGAVEESVPTIASTGPNTAIVVYPSGPSVVVALHAPSTRLRHTHAHSLTGCCTFSEMSKRDTLIEDLELSANTAAWARSLGVRTVGELLAMPTLSPPDELIEEELAAHLDDLGLVYEGELIDPATDRN